MSKTRIIKVEHAYVITAESPDGTEQHVCKTVGECERSIGRMLELDEPPTNETAQAPSGAAQAVVDAMTNKHQLRCLALYAMNSINGTELNMKHFEMLRDIAACMQWSAETSKLAFDCVRNIRDEFSKHE